MPPGLEVADIFRRHGPVCAHAHDGHIGRVERRVMSAIELCRTAALGGHVEGCRNCGTMHVAENSCRNRHCPKCQGAVARDWLEARAGDLLPVPFFNVVFTLPSEIAATTSQNKADVYGILFRTAAEPLRTIAADPKHLGAGTGLIAVLNSWDQTLSYRPLPWTPQLTIRHQLSTNSSSRLSRKTSARATISIVHDTSRVRSIWLQ